MPALDADQLFACLDRHGVQYILIGGLAAVLHGSPLPTVDADICPSPTADNLERLAAALHELDARIRTADTADGVPFPHDAAFLKRVELLNLITRVGDVDIALTPAGTSGFDDLAGRTRRLDEYSRNDRRRGGARGRDSFKGSGKPAEGPPKRADVAAALG